MQTKIEQYTSLIIAVKSMNYTDLQNDISASMNLMRYYYRHFDFSKTGNVNRYIHQYDYKRNQGLSAKDFHHIQNIMKQHYDAVHFLIADPRELLRNWMYWRDIFNMIQNAIRKYSYIIPYERHFKVDYILESLNSINRTNTFGQYIQKLPTIGLPNHDSGITMFNDSCKMAARDFNADGSTVPLDYRY